MMNTTSVFLYCVLKFIKGEPRTHIESLGVSLGFFSLAFVIANEDPLGFKQVFAIFIGFLGAYAELV